jgi:S1-C subfamily serine protease
MTTEQVRQKIADGSIPLDSMVYSPPLSAWTAVREVPELHVASVPAPPIVMSPAAPTVRPGEAAPSRARRWITSKRVLRPLLAGAGVVAGAIALTLIMTRPGGALRNADVTKTVVQVRTNESSGTGFFVEGPDEWAYVATAFHVIDDGSPVSVARAIEISSDKYYVESYPDTEIVAFDPDNDLAVIRLKNVRASRFGVARLAQKPVKDEKIFSYGLPGRTLMRRQGLLSQEGKILSVGRFPVFDDRAQKVVRDNAVDGLLISASVESGYSGGPTCNERGEVVGITTMKDRTKSQHNGAVSVEALSRLLAKVTPFDKQITPTEAQVHELIKRLEREYLLSPVEKRLTQREHEFIALTDLPGLRLFASRVRRMESSTERDTSKIDSLSSSANLGLLIARQPGSPLETYRHATVKQELVNCERNVHGLQGMFEQFAPGTKTGERDSALSLAMSECDAKSVRPLAWDLTAMTLQWEGTEREINVVKVERVDDDQPIFRASVTPKGTSMSFDVWVRQEGTDLKLKLLDSDENPYGLFTTRRDSPAALTGKWTRTNPRSPISDTVPITYQLDETLEVLAHSNGMVTVRHFVNVEAFAALSNYLPRCRSSQASGSLEQSLKGPMDGGSVLVTRTGGKRSIATLALCGIPEELFPYSFDAAMTLKIRNGKLIVYRTSGSEFPEEVEFERR